MNKSSSASIIHSIDRYLDLTANWIYSQITNLDEFEVSVFCKKTVNLDFFPYERIYALSDLPVWQQNANELIRKIRRGMCFPYHKAQAAKIAPSLIHSHFGTRGYGDLELKRKLHVPLITSFYGIDATMIPKKFPEWNKRYHRLFHRGDLFLVESQSMLRTLVSLGCDETKIKIQSLGINLDDTAFIPRSREKNSDSLKLFIASSFREKKGIPDSLDAIGRLKNELGNFTVTIAGGVVDLPDSRDEEQEIRNMIKKHNLAERINFIGFLKHKELIKESYKHDIFFATSKTARSGDNEGGTNIVILEMAASGMPVLATNHCDFSYAVGPENGKFLAEEGNVESICENLKELLKANWNLMAVTNRRHVEANFDLKCQSRKLEGIYRSMIA